MLTLYVTCGTLTLLGSYALFRPPIGRLFQPLALALRSTFQKDPAWIIVLLLLSLIPEGIPISIAGRTPNVSLFDLLLICIFLWLLIRELLHKGKLGSDRTLSVLFGLYFLGNLLSFLFSMADPPRSFFAIKVIAFGYVAYLVTRSIVRSKESAGKALFGLLAFGVITSVMLLYFEITTWSGAASEKGEMFIKDRLGSFLAAELVPVICMVMVRLFSSSIKRSFLWLAPIALLLVGLGITFSRGGIVAIAATVTLTIAAFRKYFSLWKMSAICLFAVALTLAAMPPGLLQTNYGFFMDKVEVGDPARMIIWDTSWQQFREHPVLGVGPGVIYHFNQKTDYPVQHSHNYVLNNLAELGLLGTVPYLIMLIVISRRAYRAAAQHGILFVGLFAAILGMLIHGLIEPTFVAQECTALFWIMAALIPISHAPPYTQSS